MLNRTLLAMILAAPLAVACTTESTDDELAGDDATEGDAAKADAPNGTFTFYHLEPDPRKCTEPMCGGVFYRLANATSTRCLDGSKQEKCHAPFVEWSQLGLGDRAQATIQGALGAGTLLVRARAGVETRDGVKYRKLLPTEAWIAQGPAQPQGPLVRVADNGINCIAAPCPTMDERKLNSSATAKISELDWNTSSLARGQIDAARAAIAGDDGVIIAGDRYTVTGQLGDGKGRTVTQLWTRATDVKTCVVSGCSGQICADEPRASTCEYLPEYACYQAASCEVQADGECGWTPTAELDACIADARD